MREYQPKKLENQAINREFKGEDVDPKEVTIGNYTSFATKMHISDKNRKQKGNNKYIELLEMKNQSRLKKLESYQAHAHDENSYKRLFNLLQIGNKLMVS